MPFDNINYDHNDSILRNLIAARALIADKRHWTTGIRRVWKWNGFAFCALGALDMVMGRNYACDDSDEVHCLAAFSTVSDDRHAHAVAHHNNTRGHAATLEMFDKAISARRVAMEATHAV